MPLEALTRAQQIEKENIKESFHDFWMQPQIKNRWVAPPISYAEASPMLDIAAECVVRLSGALSVSERQLLKVSGSVNAREHLWSHHHLSSARVGDRRQFVLDVVRACFSDDDGLFGISEADLTHMVDAVLEARAHGGDEAEEKALQHALIDAWHALEPIVKAHEENRAPQFGRRADRIDLLRKAVSHLNRGCKALLDFNALDEDDSEIDGDGSSDAGSGPFIREQTDAPRVEDRDVNDAAVPDEVEETDAPDVVEEPASAAAAAAATASADASGIVVEEQPATTSTTTSAETQGDVPRANTPPSVEEPGKSPQAEAKKPRTDADDMQVDEEEKAKKEGQLKIQRVAEDVEKIGVHVRNLHELADSWERKFEAEPDAGELDLDRLQRQTIAYTESLMRDLMTLDEITGAEELRPMRKRNVREVQTLLDDVDALRKRLTALHRDIKKRADTKRAEKAAQEAAAKAEAEAAANAAKPVQEDKPEESVEQDDDKQEQHHVEEELSDDESSGSHSPSPPPPRQPIAAAKETFDSVPWHTLRLEPEFHVQETADGSFELVAYVPGLKEQNVDIRLVEKSGAQQLELAGVVLPSVAQAQQLWQSAALLKRQDAATRGRRSRFAHVPVSALALRGGAGRFGTFQQRFQLPADAMASEISAQLQRGYLRVKIPRAPRRRRVTPVMPAPTSAAAAAARRGNNRSAALSPPDLFWW